jgi:PAS domain S-box-containing protein
VSGGEEARGPAVPTIVIVDDAAEVRALVRTRLRLSRKLEVVAEGGTGADAVAAAREHRPDLMLLDVSMPGMDGLEALPQVIAASPDTRVVMYSGFSEQGLAHRALELGASVFLEKSSSLATLADDLVAVLGTPRDVLAEPEEVAPEEVAPEPEEGAEVVLREHLERFREVFDDAAIGMATVTLSGQVVRANGALAALVDRPADRLVGTPYADLAGAAAEQVAAALADILTGRERVVQVEHEVTTGAGSKRVVATLAPVLDSAQRPLYLFLQVQDVTAQRGAEAQLRLSETRFRLLVENVEDYAIFMLDPDGRIASWNLGAQRIKGYTEDEIVGRHFRTFYPTELQESRHPEHELEVALRDGHYEEEGWRVRKDGTRFWANVLITAVRDSDGRHVGFAKVTRDHSQRREQEEALRQSEERFRLLVDNVGDYAIFMLDPDGRIASWNLGAQRLNGYGSEEIVGRHFRTFYPHELQSAKHPEHELEVALRDGRYEEEGWRVRKDGTRYWANVVISAVHDHDGRHVGFAKITRDTSERRQMLDALAGANAQLQLAAEDQAHFLAVTAHELRTPVGVLAGTAETLRAHWEALDDVDREELLDGMTASATRLRRLLTDLLTASRLQASALDLELGEVDVLELAQAAVATASRINNGAEVVADGDTGLVVEGDRDRLAQVLDNLIGNALRHGTAPVRVAVRRADDAVEIEVSDAGEGVPAEMRDRLFDRFATGRSRGGTGLGLFIVRQLARSHGGEATYRPPTDANPGSGQFVVSLPPGARSA